ncbi:hypothetical protein ThidrDRAFT_3669 [Thiorhodococcus drewsii AZ1]|uniref:Uncharacterized protein n=1 Tax=Thiorhodococcus drewsii AZ1 TaxID=765913 RepID=G2E5V6_9GAMM|nr:hypothetical protein [Thiorhodococcus drewsii]EGV28519.1 hypothetical protein ThidrDRAFT_3669 [Thiorhodococcus drewsii AZ1]
MKEFFTGLALSLILLPLALFGLALLAFYGLTGRIARARAGVRALDHFVNASVFNGCSWESISSHAWRERNNKRWARFVIRFADLFQQDHCKRANKREQHVVNLVLRKELHAQTIGRKKSATKEPTPANQPR